MFFLGYAVFICMLLAFCWYINPGRKEKPSGLQSFIAKSWIVFRRLVCALGVLFSLLAAILVLYADIPALEKVGFVLLCLFFTLMFGYVGLVGQGWSQYDFKDDVRLYKKVKKTYKWR